MSVGSSDHQEREAHALSSTKQIEQNLKDLDKGPLPEDVVKALDEGWERVRSVDSKYWH